MSERICRFCNNTGKHLCPDVVDPYLIDCTAKDCPVTTPDKTARDELAAAHAEANPLHAGCGVSWPSVEAEKHFLAGFDARDREVEALKAERDKWFNEGMKISAAYEQLREALEKIAETLRVSKVIHETVPSLSRLTDIEVGLVQEAYSIARAALDAKLSAKLDAKEVKG